MQSIIPRTLDYARIYNACKLNTLTFTFRLKHRINRYRRGWRYATDTWTAADAGWIGYECQDVAGNWTLESLGLDGILNDARAKWRPHPDLERLAADAGSRVGSKWNSSGDTASAASDWALDLIEEYARDENIDLVERDGEEPDEPQGERFYSKAAGAWITLEPKGRPRGRP
jgi:hypothetical protein